MKERPITLSPGVTSRDQRRWLSTTLEEPFSLPTTGPPRTATTTTPSLFVISARQGPICLQRQSSRWEPQTLPAEIAESLSLTITSSIFFRISTRPAFTFCRETIIGRFRTTGFTRRPHASLPPMELAIPAFRLTHPTEFLVRSPLPVT